MHKRFFPIVLVFLVVILISPQISPHPAEPISHPPKKADKILIFLFQSRANRIRRSRHRSGPAIQPPRGRDTRCAVANIPCPRKPGISYRAIHIQSRWVGTVVTRGPRCPPRICIRGYSHSAPSGFCATDWFTASFSENRVSRLRRGFAQPPDLQDQYKEQTFPGRPYFLICPATRHLKTPEGLNMNSPGCKSGDYHAPLATTVPTPRGLNVNEPGLNIFQPGLSPGNYRGVKPTHKPCTFNRCAVAKNVRAVTPGLPPGAIQVQPLRGFAQPVGLPRHFQKTGCRVYFGVSRSRLIYNINTKNKPSRAGHVSCFPRLPAIKKPRRG